jgi:signal transduction histidine kinase/CheY-like chemotaxis protein
MRAVSGGDLRSRVVASGDDEIAEICALFNETTRAHEERTWLGRHLARISGLLQGHGNVVAMAQLVMNELTPLVGAQQGAFFLAETADGPVLAGEPVADADVRLRMIAGYACPYPPGGEPLYALGQSLVGQVAAVRQSIEVDGAPDDYMRVSSGTGDSGKVGVIVLPVQYEGQILGVIELAAVGGFTPVRVELLEQLKEPIGVAVNAITTSARTDELLRESQRLTAELRARQEELQASNSELAEKAELLERQNADIELKTAQIEQARAALQERAQQLALASRVKSEFTANMSHELRTPLGSLLILAELLAQNAEGNLSARQVDFARTIYSAGSDLLQLINDILDLSRVEAGRMEVRAERLPLAELVDYLEDTFRPLAAEKGLELTVSLAAGAPEALVTDGQRIQQILRNLLSNAVKFTDHGRVSLAVGPDPDAPGIVQFAVTDTGVGIPQDKLRVIFEAFQQADGTAGRQFSGTGLGLSISRELTQLLGGDLRVRSTMGRGSTFTLRLPVEPAAERAEAAPDSKGAARSRLASPATIVILVVEPGGSGALLQAAEATVEGLAGVKEPVEVVAAPGADAIASALAGRNAVAVLLDQATAEAEAEAVADQLAEAGSDLLLLVVGAAPDGGAAERLAAAGGGRHRIEPVSSVPQVAERLTLHLLTTLPRTDGLLNEREPGRAATRFRGEKVLLVDDDMRTVFALTSALELHGLTIIHAENGLRALDVLKQQPDVALVLMDLMMPGMDGYATTRKIRATAEFADLPIIVVTAKAMREDRDKSLAAGANEYVTKPVDVAALLGLIRRTIREPAGADSPYAGDARG